MDLDGTLVEVAPTPDEVIVQPAVIAAIGRAHCALGGAVAVVSGRSIAELDRLLAPLCLPTAGLHGLEQRRAGAHQPATAAGVTPAARAALAAVSRDLQAFANGHAGAMIEDKGLAVALHYRAAPRLEKAARAAVEAALSGHDALHCVAGKMVLEVKPAGASKGSAVAAFMAAPPFAGRVPVFIGDDRTDEDGFAAVNRMAGISVRVGPPPPNLATSRARWQCAGVPELAAWLGTLSDRLEQS